MANAPRAKQRTLTGIVVSDKMTKTRVVAVTRLKRHPKYLKFYKVTMRFKAHDGENQYHTGDTVVIAESRPLSKEKRWVIKGLAREDKSIARTQSERIAKP